LLGIQGVISQAKIVEKSAFQTQRNTKENTKEYKGHPSRKEYKGHPSRIQSEYKGRKYKEIQRTSIPK
jgi:hypothetical protein